MQTMSPSAATILLLLLLSGLIHLAQTALEDALEDQYEEATDCFGQCTVRGATIDCGHTRFQAASVGSTAVLYLVHSGNVLHVRLIHHGTAVGHELQTFSISSFWAVDYHRDMCDMTDEIKIQMDSCCTYQLLPESLDSFADMRLITLEFNFTKELIPAGVFTANFVNLRDLRILSPAISKIEPGAFKKLRNLTRLHISNLRMLHLSSSILQGLRSLRYLELPGNSLLSLDAASFAASPGLESIDLSTTSEPGLTTVDSDTFCGLTKLQHLQYGGSLQFTCTLFLSPRIHLMKLHGTDKSNASCFRNHSDSAECNVGAGILLPKIDTRPADRLGILNTSTRVSRSVVVMATTIGLILVAASVAISVAVYWRRRSRIDRRGSVSMRPIFTGFKDG